MATHVTWFSNTSTNHHMTPDFTTMTSSKSYLDNDQLYVGDGKVLLSHILLILKLKHQMHFYLI